MTCIKISALSITMDDVDYKMKYIKYKVKYLQLLEELEGGFFGLSKKEKEQKLKEKEQKLKEKEQNLEKELKEIFEDIKNLQANVEEDSGEVNDIKDNKRNPLIEHIQEIKIIENTEPTLKILNKMYEYFDEKENKNKKKIFIDSLYILAQEFEKKNKSYHRIRRNIGKLT